MLYDAVAVLASVDGAALLAATPRPRTSSPTPTPTARFIGHVPSAAALFQAAGLTDLIDAGYIDLDTAGVDSFIAACRQIRYWDREPSVDAL